MGNRFGRMKYLATLLVVVLAFAGCYFHGDGGGGQNGPAASLVLKSAMTGYTGTVRVTAAGMTAVTATIAATDEAVTLEIPSGTARTVTVNFEGATATLQGTTTVDLVAGETKSLKIPLNLKSTKIVVPDGVNNRIVQIDDMTGKNWKTKTATDFAATATTTDLMPALVDFDNRGRIYLFNVSLGTVLPAGLMRFPDIDRTSEYETLVNYEVGKLGNKVPGRSASAIKGSTWKKTSLSKTAPLASKGLTGKFVTDAETPGSMALDRTNNYFYYSANRYYYDGTTMTSYGKLYRADVSGTIFSPSLVFDISEEFAGKLSYDYFEMYNITVDSAGIIYAICDLYADGYSNVVVLLIDLSKPVGSRTTMYDGQSVQGLPTDTGAPIDMQFRGNLMYVYCSMNLDVPTSPVLIAVSKDMVYKGSYGVFSEAPSKAGEFIATDYSSITFLRGVSDTLYIIDDDPMAMGYDRLIGIGDITGSGWTTYGTTGTGEGQFMFYYPSELM